MQLGDNRQTAQFAAALHEQNYDRAARIAHGDGPYLSPDKAQVAPTEKTSQEVLDHHVRPRPAHSPAR